MNNLSDVGTIKEIMEKNGFGFNKGLGQNFLINPSVCPKMAEACGADGGSGVIEIGAGIGVLTCELAKKAGKVISFELDKKLIPVLAQTLSDYNNIEIINTDILKSDVAALISEKFAGMRVCVCANLPYYITSPIIMYLLESRLPLENLTVMVQKEAADRLCAEVGSRDSGAVTVAVNYYAEAQKLFNVSKGSFMPAPKVDSTVIRLNIRREPPVKVSDEKFFFRLVKAAFAQRRKTAVNSISAGTGIPKPQIETALRTLGYDTNIRAEKFTMDDFAAVSDALSPLSVKPE